MAFGGVFAKQSQDDKPLTHQEPVRTASVSYGLRSQSPLRSRCGMEVSATWPPLTRLSSAPLITARPFGLGCRFDEAPSSSGGPYRAPSRWKYRTNPAKAGPRYHSQRTLASDSDKVYLLAFRQPREGPPAVSRRQTSPGATSNRSGAFARLGPLPSNQPNRSTIP
jgi:hypothetical protein